MDRLNVRMLNLNIQILGLSFVLMAFSLAHAQVVDDLSLAEQRAGEEQLSPEMMSLAQHDAHIPMPEQIEKHQHLAKEQSDQIKKQTLENTAASDYEIKRKTDNTKLMNEARKVYIPAKTVYKAESRVSESSMNFNSGSNVKGSGTATATTEKF